MKTVFITISRGVSARNILMSDIFSELKKSGEKIVILTPAYQDGRFLKEFSGDNVFFENLIEPKWGAWDKFLVGWHKALIYNNSTKMRDRYGIYSPREGGRLKYAYKKIFFWPLSKIKFFKNFFRWLDKILVRPDYYKDIFDKYKPDLVFSTSIMEDADVFVLKEAQKRGVKTIGMAKTWDNISKMSFRVKTGRLLVWGNYSKDEAMRFQNYKEKDISICGIPQFDFYKKPEYLVSREDFCREVGLDPDKKIIVFCSEGKVAKHDGEIAEIIFEFITGGRLLADASLFIRPHFMYIEDEEKFLSLKGKPSVVLDGGYEHSQCFRDKWDYSKRQIKHLTNIMNHADVVITSASTISLDAAAFDKPVINIAFDGYASVPFAESIAHWYLTEYTKNVLATGGIRVAGSKEELLDAINGYFKDRGLLKEGREKLRNYFCYKIDGLSGKRAAKEILNYVIK